MCVVLSVTENVFGRKGPWSMFYVHNKIYWHNQEKVMLFTFKSVFLNMLLLKFPFILFYHRYTEIIHKNFTHVRVFYFTFLPNMLATLNYCLKQYEIVLFRRKLRSFGKIQIARTTWKCGILTPLNQKSHSFTDKYSFGGRK